MRPNRTPVAITIAVSRKMWTVAAPIKWKLKKTCLKFMRNCWNGLEKSFHLRPSPVEKKLYDVEDQRNLCSTGDATSVRPHSITRITHREVQKRPDWSENPVWRAPSRSVNLLVPRIHVGLGANPKQSRSNDRNWREDHNLNDFVVDEAHFRRFAGWN